MAMIERDIRASKHFKRSLATLAHQVEIPLSVMLRSWVTEYAEGPAKEAPAPASQEARMRVAVDDEVWAAALARARKEGISLAEEIRRRGEQELARATA